MAYGLSNAELKQRNEKIFKRIENKLGSEDEATFLRAMQKLSSFISKPQAYYTEARPVIVLLCKTARATLTRLANSGTPFCCSQPYPEELKGRVATYATLMGTVRHHASSFENDEHLKDDLKDLFLSVMAVPPQPPSRGTNEGLDHKQEGAQQSTIPHESAISARDGLKSSKQPMSLREFLSEQNRTPTGGSISPSTDSPMTPPLTPTTNKDNPKGEPIPPAKPGAGNKPAGKANKIKLKKAAPVSSSLIEADLNWLSSKQSQASGPTDLPDAGSSSHRPSTPTQPDVQLPRVDSSAGQTFGNHVEEVPDGDFSTHKESEGITSASGKADNSITDSKRPASQSWELDVGQGQRVDIVMADAQSHASAGPTPSQNGLPLKGIFDISALKFSRVESGRDVGEKLILQYDLSPDQLDSLSVWQTRDEHERDPSSGLCLSMACYRKVDAIRSGFSSKNADKDPESVASLLMELTPIWPTNSRLSADVVGSFRMFLSPPLVLTKENLNDITHHVKGTRIELHFDHAGDMREYLFALVLHPPTPSQLRELEEEKASRRKFRETLDNLRITALDIFG